MSRIFRGESRHKVDAKGRVSIPASYRRVLEAADPNWTSGDAPDLVIVYGDHRRKYLECFTMEAVAEIDVKIAALPRGSKPRRMLHRLFHGLSFPTSVDETGRLVLPQKLREKIGIDKEAYFFASGDTFQIWHPDTFKTDVMEETEDWLDELPDDMDAMELLDQAEGV